MSTEDQDDYAILFLATGEPATFRLLVHEDVSAEWQNAFNRGLFKDWYRLIDVDGHNGVAVKVFRLTDKGWYRRKVLEDKKT